MFLGEVNEQVLQYAINFLKYEYKRHLVLMVLTIALLGKTIEDEILQVMLSG